MLISAPAGFGKSSCLVEWAHHLKDHHVQVAWYALDEHDNDPARFAAYLLQSCLAADRALLAHADSSLQSDLHEAVNQLLNAASDYAQPLVLILDDYHLIKTPQIHDAVGRMCDRMPPNMRLAIGTRADPPLQLARLRARGEMAELRLGDLRFTKPEIAAWLHTKLGWNPSPDFLTRLDAMTEGWAAENLLHAADTADLAALSGRFVAGSVVDYLQTTIWRNADIIPITFDSAIWWVLPHTIQPGAKALPNHHLSLRIAVPMGKSIIEICQGKQRIWKQYYRRLIPNLPVYLLDTFLTALHTTEAIRITIQSSV